MGHPNLYVQYIGSFVEKDEDQKEISTDVIRFVEERTKNSYSKINNKKTNIKEYIDFLLN